MSGSVPSVMLLSNNDIQNAVPHVSSLLDQLQNSNQHLGHLWQLKKMRLEQCFQLRLFESEVEKVTILFSYLAVYKFGF